MDSFYQELKSQIADSVRKAAKAAGYDAEGAAVEVSKSFGDLSCSVAFKIAKEKKENPLAIAERISAKIGKTKSVDKVTTEGGYLNFHLNRADFADNVIHKRMAIDPYEPISDIGKSKKVMVEFLSANPIHPLHVGQLRNMLIGDAIAKVHESCGYSVERENYIDDLGLQAMIALYGYMRMGEKAKPDKKFDHWLGGIYADANKDGEKPGFKEGISKLSGMVEQDGTYESKIARELAEQVVRAHYETSANYRSWHDVLVWESDILRAKLLEKALTILMERKILQKEVDGEYKGCTVLDLTKIKDLPKEFAGLKEKVKVMIRSDGTPTYVAKDVAYHMWKFGMLEDTFRYGTFIEKQWNGKPVYTTASDGKRMDFAHVARTVNVIDVKQDFPQALLRLVFNQMGKREIADGINHLSYGRVELEEGTLAGRKGIAIENTADGLLDEADERALRLISERVKMSEDEKDRIARSVALSAIKFAFLKVTPEKWITFSWKWALSFEGDTGPYCQYMNARATRLIEDSGVGGKDIAKFDPAVLSSENEFALVKMIAGMRDVVEKSCAELRPNVLTEYANGLAYSFGKFYENSSVLKASSDKEKIARLALVLAFRNTMKVVLHLIGIDSLERM